LGTETPSKQLLLIMTWLAVKLGVDEAVLAERLNRR
jgi:hypothetical protein